MPQTTLVDHLYDNIAECFPLPPGHENQFRSVARNIAFIFHFHYGAILLSELKQLSIIHTDIIIEWDEVAGLRVAVVFHEAPGKTRTLVEIQSFYGLDKSFRLFESAVNYTANAILDDRMKISGPMLDAAVNLTKPSPEE